MLAMKHQNNPVSSEVAQPPMGAFGLGHRGHIAGIKAEYEGSFVTF